MSTLLTYIFQYSTCKSFFYLKKTRRKNVFSLALIIIVIDVKREKTLDMFVSVIAFIWQMPLILVSSIFALS